MFAALADLTVDPCAQIVGNYLRGNGLDKCRESFQGVHLLSAVRGMEKGRRNSIAQKPVSRNFDAIPVFVHLFVLYALDLAQIVGGILVNIVVQPVLRQQVGVGTPAEQRRLCGIIVRVVIHRHMDGQALVHIAAVL